MAISEVAPFLDEENLDGNHLAPSKRHIHNSSCSSRVSRNIRGVVCATVSVTVMVLTVSRVSSGPVARAWFTSRHTLRPIVFSSEAEETDTRDYIMSIDGMNRCGSGSVRLNVTECKEMPRYFGGELHNPLTISSASDPRGCFKFWKWYYYNTHPRGEALKDRTPLCRITSTGESSSSSGDSGVSEDSSHEKSKRDSLFCFSLIASIDSESPLLALQFYEQLGLFACDDHVVYSSHSFDLVPGFKTTAININTTCEMGGPFWTCLNSWIFIEVWKLVVSGARYQSHDWTVKLDPDAVFFPGRAINALRGVPDPKAGLYIINCKQGDGYGLHGPIEVLSRNAVQTYADGWERCVKGPHRLHFGLWGEDFFLDECLKKLDVSRREDGHFLSEPHCDAPDTSGTFKGEGNDAWKGCNHTRYVTFHPFKTKDKYRDCIANAADT